MYKIVVGYKAGGWVNINFRRKQHALTWVWEGNVLET